MDEELEQDKQEQNGQHLIICTKIDNSLCGELLNSSPNKAEVFFVPKESMISDEVTIHSGFVFNAAAYTALCAVNKKNSIIIGSEVKFLAPIELGHEILFKAVALNSEGKKCEVKVEGFLLDIKIFDGIFYVAIFDRNLFKLKLKDNKGNK